MKTEVINITTEYERALTESKRLINDGEVVGIPTETVYGLGANALDEDAVKKIFVAKGRPSDNPLIVHIAKFEDLKPLVNEIPEKVKIMAEKFWPAPLTMIMKKSSFVAMMLGTVSGILFALGMCMALLHLDFKEAMQQNCLLFFLLPVLLVYGIWKAVTFVKYGDRPLNKVEQAGTLVLFVLMVAFWILRNTERFAFLAPRV